MRRLVLASVLVLAGSVLADDDKLPVDPAANLAQGDWSVFMETRRTGLKSPTTLTLTKADGDDLVFTVAEAGQKDEERRVSRQKLATLSGVVGFFFGKDRPAADYSNVKVEDDKRKTGDKEWSCKKVSATIKGGRRSAEVACWFSADVKRGLGLVALEAHEGGRETRYELVGYGAKATDWGMDSAAAAKAALEKAPQLKGEDDKLALDLLQGAKEGDWTAIVVNVSGRKLAGTLTIKKIDEKSVTYVASRANPGSGDVPGERTVERTKLASLRGLVEHLFEEKLEEFVVTGVTTVDEKRSTVGGDLACKKTSATISRPDGTNKAQAVVWLSSDVKRGFRLVAVEVGAGDAKESVELVGYGAEKKEWGKTAEEAAAALK